LVVIDSAAFDCYATDDAVLRKPAKIVTEAGFLAFSPSAARADPWG